MPHTKIKICGVRNTEIAQAAIEAGADFIGLVFFDRSPRLVDNATARHIADVVGNRVMKVGLFVDAPVEVVHHTATDVGLDAVQLHGHESIDYARQLADLRVIKAVSAPMGQIADVIKPWFDANLVNLKAVLIDAMTAPGELPGGMGRSFDWSEFARDPRLSPAAGHIMLAGGLTPINVGDAVRAVRPWAVDVSSGVESSRGVKDAGLIRAFCDAVRRADESR